MYSSGVTSPSEMAAISSAGDSSSSISSRYGLKIFPGTFILFLCVREIGVRA